MADRGSTDVPELAAIMAACAFVDVRLALINVEDAWQVLHGEVTLHAAATPTARIWHYAEEIFLSQRIPGVVVAALLLGETQDVDGLKITAPATTTNANFERVAGHGDRRPAVMPWPRTQWDVSPAQSGSTRQGGLLVGDGPAFVSYEAAFSSFFLAAAPSNQANQQPLWRIIQLDRRAWLHRITISADRLTAQVKGTTLDGVSLELSTPTGDVVRAVGPTGRVRLRLPQGLAPSSLLLLRSGGQWLDYRYFISTGPGQQRDESVVWDQPEAELALLLAGGEGLYTEFKRDVPTLDSSKKTVLKTIAAFASGQGGTLLFGVEDDAQIVGVDPLAMDRLTLAVINMIRNSIDPIPQYDLRAVQADGKTVLLVEVTGTGRWHALGLTKAEFFVRRGASTVPARLHEVAAGFGQIAGTSHRGW